MSAQPSFFDAPPSSIQVGMQALEATAARPQHQRMLALLIPVARELARRSPAGVTISDVREEAVRQGLLPEVGTKRGLSFLGKLLSLAGLVDTGMYRRSTVLAAHGNLNKIFRAP